MDLSPACCRLCAQRLEQRARNLRRRNAEAEFNAAQDEARGAGGCDEADREVDSGPGDRLKAAEQELDAAMEAELDFMCHEDGSEEDDGVEGFDDYEEDEEDEGEEDGGGGKDEGRGDDGGGTPLHFSTLPSVGDAIKGAGAPLEVDLRAGEMLFLPCGWFHEVTSLSTGPEGHLAFNYWFWPPDGSSAERPYISPFWEADFRSAARAAGSSTTPEAGPPGAPARSGARITSALNARRRPPRRQPRASPPRTPRGRRPRHPPPE